ADEVTLSRALEGRQEI
ncbi:MAG: hypothetical protein ACI4PO_09005, partial [Faecousia sp.]